MCDALGVRGGERAGDLPGVLQGFLHRKRTFKWRAFDVLHDQVIRADVVQRTNVGMIQRRDGFGFSLEAFAELRIGNFERNDAIETGIARLKYLAHSAFTDRRKNFIGPEFIAY